jgi:hypothetical protein
MIRDLRNKASDADGDMNPLDGLKAMICFSFVLKVRNVVVLSCFDDNSVAMREQGSI